MGDKVSIIVPIFSVGKYLPDTILSLTSQSYGELEIILVDDGSSDNCPFIIDEYKKKDERIIAIHQANGGVSNARNAGLDVARGKFVMFIDGDDSLTPTAVENLIGLVSDCDTVCYNWQKVFADKRVEKSSNIPSGLVFIGEHNKEKLYEQLLKDNILGSVCLKIFTKSIIDKYKIRFREDMFYLEDQVFCNDYFTYASNIKFVDDCFYNYSIREGSAIRGFNPKKLDNTIKLVEYLTNKANTDWQINESLSKKLIDERLVSFFYMETFFCEFVYNNSKADKIAYHKTMINHPCFRNVEAQNFSKKLKILYRVLTTKPLFLRSLMVRSIKHFSTKKLK